MEKGEPAEKTVNMLNMIAKGLLLGQRGVKPCHSTKSMPYSLCLGEVLVCVVRFSQPFLGLSNGTYSNSRLLRLPHPFFFKGILKGSVIDDLSPLDRFFLTMFDLRNIPDSYSQ